MPAPVPELILTGASKGNILVIAVPFPVPGELNFIDPFLQ